ncbi:MAG: histidine kinase [Putridiphycobacter sp.]
MHAQNDEFRPVFENLVDEFSGSEVYDIYQDNKGYVWFTTDAGIEKYDGKKMITYDLSAYCNASVAFNFFIESDEKVWFNTITNDLLWFNPLEKTFNPHFYLFNAELKEELNSYVHKNFVRKMYFTKYGWYFTFLKGLGYIKIDTYGKCKTHKRIDPFFKNQTLAKPYLSISDSLNYSFFEKESDDRNVSVLVDGDTNTIILEKAFQKTWYYGIADIEENENGKYIAYGTNVILINGSKIHYQNVKFDILDILLDGNRILVSTFNGVYLLDENLKEIDHFLTGYTVTNSLLDKQTNYWFSTLEKGVFFTKNILTKQTYYDQNISPTHIEKLRECFLVLNNNYELFVLDEDLEIMDDVKSVYYFGGYYSSRDDIRKWVPIKVARNFFSFPEFCKERNFAVINKAIYWLENEKLIKSVYLDIQEEFNDIVFLKDSFLLICSSQGLFDYNYNTDVLSKAKVSHDSTLNYRFGFEMGNHICLLSNFGVHIYSRDKAGYPVPEFRVEKSGINGYKKMNDSLFYLYYQNELAEISVEKNSWKYSVINLSNQIPAKEILSLEVDSNFFYFGTKKGITRINQQELLELNQSNVGFFVLDSILSGNQHVDLKDTLVLEFDSTLTIYYNYVDYFSKYSIEYQLDNSPWFQSGLSNLRIEQLDKGFHNLKIRVNYHTNGIPTVYQQIIFVKTPYWETLWFKMLGFVSFIIFIFVFVRIYLSRKNRKQKMELEKLNLELKFLTAQMNPHFTFNTISSIQSYIINNKKNDAIQYLSDYAHLMRKSLDYSFEETISIANEIEFINAYVSLENRRFQKKYVVDYKIDKQLDLNQFKIPCFLIQPLIENIINHAHYAKDDKLEINIHFEELQEFILIKVVDFGQGMKEGKSLSAHKSYGLDILLNRLKIHNKSKFDSSQLNFEYTNKKNKTGTTVIIKLLKT